MYFGLAVILLVGLFINLFLVGSPKNVLGLNTNITPEVLLNETNQERVKYHLPILTLNSELSQAAFTKASNMVQLNYWSHYTPNGEPPWSFITNAGYNYQSAGENLAYGFTSSQALVTAWMNSPPHRKNILDRVYQNVGFGIIDTTNYMGQGPSVLVDAMYGQPAVKLAPSTNVVAATFVKTNSPPQSVNIFQQLTGISSQWSVLILTAFVSSLLTFLIIKHTLKWRKVLIYSEEYVVSHPMLDILIMLLIVGLYTISRTTGYIG